MNKTIHIDSREYVKRAIYIGTEYNIKHMQRIEYSQYVFLNINSILSKSFKYISIFQS